MKPNRSQPLNRRLLALALCLMMALQLLPLSVLAATSKTLAPAETEVDAKAVDVNDNPIDVKVKQYTYTFTDADLPDTPEEIAQYDLDTPYDTMALLILAFRTWTPENPDTCLKMLDYLTDTGSVIAGTETPCPFSQYTPWVNALKERMTQKDKYQYIGNAYLGGATKDNDYTPTTPYTITLRQSVYDPYKKADGDSPEVKQVLISLAGSENDRYSLFVQDDSGQWKVKGSNWLNLLADVQTPEMDILLPPETGTPGTGQKEPDLKIDTVPAKAAGVDENGDPIIIDTTVEQYTYTFTTIPKTYEDIIQYKLDSPYKTMALYFLALRTWTPEDQNTCARMLDYLTNPNVDSGLTSGGKKLSKKFSEYKAWTDFLAARMKQNEKYRFIGNAYLGGACPENNYAPDGSPNGPVTVTLRQSTYDPYKAAQANSPELKQVLIHIDGADNDRYGLLYQDQRGDWRFFSDNWKGLLADVKTPLMDIYLPPETGPLPAKRTQVEPVETVYDVPAKAAAVDEGGNPIVIDTTVKQHTFTFSTVPTNYEEIIQYKLDSPYKTMALMLLAFRTWTPADKTTCAEMMDYLTNVNYNYKTETDSNGRKLSQKFSTYNPWLQFLNDRMSQNNKYRYIGNAYLGGAMPSNDYTPSEPVTITLRESVYNPYKIAPSSTAGSDAEKLLNEASQPYPTLYQVLISLPGADNDRYSLFYKDQRGDWRVYGDNWQGLLADVKTPSGDIPLPPEVVRSTAPATPQTDPAPKIDQIPAKAVDENDKPIDVEVDQYTFTFPKVPTCYEDIVQYKLDSPYKTMALFFLALKSWTPDNPKPCLEMLDYLTCTAVPEPGKTDKDGKPLCYPFSGYYPWISFLYDRMMQNDKYEFIGDAYLKGASPENGYTPDSPVTVVVRQSVYDPYKAKTETTPELKQVLVSIDGADNDRYGLFYCDQRGDWRFFGDNWMGLLADVQEIREPGAITKPQLDPVESQVTFQSSLDPVKTRALVASYGEDGQLIGIAEAELVDGQYQADVEAKGYSYKIFMVDKNDAKPLCKSVPLSK